MSVATKWCPDCEAEYRPGVTTCPDCGVPLVDALPAPVGNRDRPPEAVEPETVVYDFADWTEEERRGFDRLLRDAGIPFTWDNASALVVAGTAEGAVDQLLYDQRAVVEEPAVADDPGSPVLFAESGQGRGSPVPAEIERWNWGAFFLGPLWGIGNGVYTPLLVLALGLIIAFLSPLFVPSMSLDTYTALLATIGVANLVMALVLGAMGSACAWQNRRWASVDHFRRVQRHWAVAGLVVFLLGLAVGLAPLLSSDGDSEADYGGSATELSSSEPIYVMGPDGGELRSITGGSEPTGCPQGDVVASPDGTRIAFCREGEIHVEDLENGSVTKLTDSSGASDGAQITCDDRKPQSQPTPKTYSSPPEMTIDPAKSYTATLDTSCGVIVVELDARRTPKTVNNFVFLARENFYDGLTWHRVVEDFVIQGGDPKGDGTGGPGYTFEDELPPGGYMIGSVAMANTGPDANGSEFFIVTGEKGTQLPNNYSRFGTVSRGVEVAQKLGSFAQPDQRPSRTLYIFDIAISES